MFLWWSLCEDRVVLSTIHRPLSDTLLVLFLRVQTEPTNDIICKALVNFNHCGWVIALGSEWVVVWEWRMCFFSFCQSRLGLLFFLESLSAVLPPENSVLKAIQLLQSHLNSQAAEIMTFFGSGLPFFMLPSQPWFDLEPDCSFAYGLNIVRERLCKQSAIYLHYISHMHKITK